MKLRPEILDKKVFIPHLRKTIVGKFIPESLYPILYKKYKSLFEEDALPINNTITTNSNNTTEDTDSDDFLSEL